MSDATDNRAAILRMTPEALTALLQLPPGAYIDAVTAPHDCPGVLEVRIRGAGWVTAPGMLLRRVVATVSQQYDADGTVLRYSIDYGFPIEGACDGAH